MTDILRRITKRKREEVAEAKARIPEAHLRERAEAAAPPSRRTGFRERLSAPGPSGVNIIAEIKRASPSRGDIRPHLDPAAVARQYESGGAACISVLTDRDFFKGSDGDFQAARAAAPGLPMIRKDFTISPYQIYEAAVMAADAVLLIVRILTPAELRDFLEIAESLGMDALVETHDEAEIDAALAAGARLVGVNNRSLRSFETDVTRSARLAGRIGGECVMVAESGVQSRRDVEDLQEAGIFNFLIGERIAGADDPAAAIRELSGISS